VVSQHHQEYQACCFSGKGWDLSLPMPTTLRQAVPTTAGVVEKVQNTAEAKQTKQ
jgi:hypothetical protein